MPVDHMHPDEQKKKARLQQERERIKPYGKFDVGFPVYYGGRLYRVQRRYWRARIGMAVYDLRQQMPDGGYSGWLYRVEESKLTEPDYSRHSEQARRG